MDKLIAYLIIVFVCQNVCVAAVAALVNLIIILFMFMFYAL